MKVLKTEGYRNNDENKLSLEKIINLIENDRWEIAKNYLDILINDNELYSDAYVFRFLVCMNLKKYDCAAKDVAYAFSLEKRMKLVKPKYFIADVLREFWMNCSSADRKCLRNELELLTTNLKIV